MSPQWIDSPAVGPEALAVGNQAAPPGQKEIHFDSTAARMAYESGGMSMPDAYPQAEYREVPPEALADLPSEVRDAMVNGQPPPPHLMPKLALPPPQTPAFGRPRVQSPALVELVIPVGSGVTAHVEFQGGIPSGQHWRKLIRHLEIEADEEQQPTAVETRSLEATERRVNRRARKGRPTGGDAEL